MKTVIITLALAGLASTATVDAQILGTRLPTPTTSSRTSVDGWRWVSTDRNGNRIYERRVTDRNGNIIVQRARRDANRMSIISSRTVSNTSNRNRRNCDYTRTTNSISDRIFNRSNDVSCDDVGNLEDNGWYQVGRGPNNNSIYMRRTRDANDRLVIQRGRLNRDGTFTILSTRYANDNDRQWRKDQKKRDKEWRKEEKRQDKESRKSQRGDHDDDDDDRRFRRGDDRFFGSNTIASSNGNGRNNGKGKHKGKH